MHAIHVYIDTDRLHLFPILYSVTRVVEQFNFYLIPFGMASTAHRTAAEYVEYLDDESTLDQKVTQLAEWVREAHHFIAFTGAGISTACGIPDFRSGT
jgi:hypothetical protein